MHIFNWKVFKRMLMLMVLGVTTIVVIFFAWIFLQIQSLPKINPQSLKTNPPTKIYDRNNQVIWESASQHIQPLTYAQIPSLYRDALIQVEDNSFWKNQGYSTSGVLNMAYTTIASKLNPNIIARGGSTFEQQLIKNVYFQHGNDIKTSERKVKEIYLAQQLDHNFSKKEILTDYVNNLQFAQGDQGVGSVMMTYFGKTPQDYQTKTPENIAQQAYLAGLGQNPTIYDLYTNPKWGIERMNIVLNVMYTKHLITKDEYQQAKQVNIQKTLKPNGWETKAILKKNLKYKAYTDAVLQNVTSQGYNLNDVSLQIHTYLDPKTYDQITQTVRKDKYYQDGRVGEEQGAATVINHDGIVIGMVGSRHANDEYNRAIQRNRSSGSSLKPFTAYGPLFQYLGNQYNTASTFDSSAYRYPGTDLYMKNWGGFSYGTVTANRALKLSLNTVVGRIDDEILGSTRMKTFLSQVGLDVKSSYSARDGIGLNISTLQAAAAWNCINNGGIYTEPRFVDYIQFPDNTRKQMQPQRHRAMNQSTAYVLQQMLRGVLTGDGTGVKGRINKYSGYAAKTGTVGLPNGSHATNKYGDGGSDSWFDSITKNGYAIALWFGYDNPDKSPKVSDDFYGPMYLGRDLQLNLTGNLKSLSNWTQPNHVNDMGNGNYAITDSHDLSAGHPASVSEMHISNRYQQINSLTKVQPKQHQDIDWALNLTGKEQKFYNLYNDDHHLSDHTDVINQNFYDLLPKRKGD